MLTRPLQPLDERTRTFAIGGGLILVGCGVMLLVTTIQATCGKGNRSGLSFCTDLLLDLLRARDVGNGHSRLPPGPLRLPSTSSRQLTRGADRADPPRLGGLRLAGRHQTLPRSGAGRGPGGSTPIRDSPLGLVTGPTPRQVRSAPLVAGHAELECHADLRLDRSRRPWRVVVRDAAIHPASAVSQFAYSFLFGMGLMAGLRVKGFGKRLLLWLPPWRS